MYADFHTSCHGCYKPGTHPNPEALHPPSHPILPDVPKEGGSIREDLIRAVEEGDFKGLKKMLDRERAKTTLRGLSRHNEDESTASGLLRLLNEVAQERWWFFERELNPLKVISVPCDAVTRHVLRMVENDESLQVFASRRTHFRV